MFTICLYGPESVGKTTLAKELATNFNSIFVPEVSREMVTSNNFTIIDIIEIGNAQTAAILEAKKENVKLIFCDTDLITTQIYSKIYLDFVPDILFDLEKKLQFDMYFLLDIDVPWVADGLRDLEKRRKEVYNIFKNELEKRNIPYVIVKGNWEARKKIVIEKINELLADSTKPKL